MTGGVGFSKQASQSFDENHRLGKIRPKSTYFKGSRNLEKADSKTLSQAIDHRNERKINVKKSRVLVFLFVILAVSALIFYFL